MGSVTCRWRKMTKGACAIPTRAPPLRNLRCLLIGHVWAEPFPVPELTELLTLMAIAVATMFENGHEVRKYKYYIFITYLLNPWEMCLILLSSPS